ncbi:MAG: hydrogenase nickel incorporation protein HypB [Myxococcota bacterium]
MCESCGCGDPEIVPVEVKESILAANDHEAAHNREHFDDAGVLALNIMGSPGSGKTALLEATAACVGAERLAAVSGDLATERDAERLGRVGIRSRAITTGQSCHLDARLIHRSLHGFSLDGVEIFFIENVGNLVCPAIYDLGQAANVVVISVTEGHDKPLKYPVMFRKADLVVLSKVDLLPHLPDFDVPTFVEYLGLVMPAVAWLPVSATRGDGMQDWADWLHALRRTHSDQTRVEHALHHDHDHDHGRGHDHGHGHGGDA